MQRLFRLHLLHMGDENKNLYDDIAVESRQAIEMTNSDSDILSGKMPGFASIASNNFIYE